MGNMLLRCVMGFVVALVMTMHGGAAGGVANIAVPAFGKPTPCSQMPGAKAFLSDDQPDGDAQDERAPRKALCKIDMTPIMADALVHGVISPTRWMGWRGDPQPVTGVWPVSEKPPNLRSL